MKSSIIKPSSFFKKNSLRKIEIANSVDTFLYQINSEIETANKENKNKTALRLPSSFNIPEGIDHKKFQIEVYYNIVNILENKGYKVKIKTVRNGGTNGNHCFGDNNILYIFWETESEHNVDEMYSKLFKLNI